MKRTASLILFLASLLAAPAADAGRVIVLSVQGDSKGEVEDGLVSIVEDRHDLVTSGEAERVARKAGYDDLDGKTLGKLAKKLKADAVIEGQVSREDEGYTLVIRVRGQDGKTVKKITVDMPKPKLTSKQRKRLGTGLLDGIDRTLGVDAEEDDEEAEEEERPRRQAKKAKAKKAKKARKEARRAAVEVAAEDDEEPEIEVDDEEAADEDAEADEDDEEEGERRVAMRDDDEDLEAALGVEKDDGEARPKKARPQPGLRVEVGPSGKQRTLSFTSTAGFEQAPLGYQSAMVPGAHVDVQAYPLALFGGGAAAGLGIGFAYDQTIGLKTFSSDAPMQPMATDQRHWAATARYRLPFGKKVTSPSMTVAVGYGRRVFTVDRSVLPDGAILDMPDVDYKYIEPGLGFRVPIGRRFALHAGGKGLLFQTAGPIQATTSYGGATITGFEAGGGFEIGLAKGAFVNVAGSMTRIGYEFVGNGEETNNRDLDASTQDVFGALDQYIGVVGTVGFAY